jgi:hypothetical protein
LRCSSWKRSWRSRSWASSMPPLMLNTGDGMVAVEPTVMSSRL